MSPYVDDTTAEVIQGFISSLGTDMLNSATPGMNKYPLL